MSKITYSGIAVTESAGKAENFVYSRNRGGHFKRSYVVPVYPATPNQVSWTSAFSGIASIWQMLPEDVRQLWNNAADQFYRKNTLANNYRLSGYNYFIQQTINILLANGAPTFAPVLPRFTDEVIRARFNILTTTVMQITLNMLGGSTVIPGNMTLILFATTGVSQGINYKRTGYSGFYSFNPTDSTNHIDVMSQYLLVYPAPTVGQKIFIRAAFYHAITGQKSEWFYFSGIVS